MWNKVRILLRGGYRLAGGVYGFFYDITRFIKYSGWRGRMNDLEERNYNAAMIYHGLEKSLSYKKRNADSGWRNAYSLVNIIRAAKCAGVYGFHDKAAITVLEEFVAVSEDSEKSAEIVKEIENLKFVYEKKHGVIKYSKSEFREGVLDSPEGFFFSRYSLREFENKEVSKDIVERAVNLAMKTPSVCNRQAWGVYHTTKPEVKEILLSYQNGNKPFGHKIPNLMVITADLKAFFSGKEHYQHWIDGGMFSMSLIYAFHSLGIATCPLNWSQEPYSDKAVRKKLNIKPHHTIVMILAIGYPSEENIVCASARRPMEEIFMELIKKA